jgi:hypothetical protein
MLAQTFGIAAIPFGLRDRQSLVLARPGKIKMVGAKNLQVAELVPQTKFVIGLELVTMAGSADTLKVFPAIWIASF